MNTEDVLDDYLIELLGDAQPAAAVIPPLVADAAPVREPTWDDLPAEVVYETGPAPLAGDVVIAVADDADLQAAFDAVATAEIASAAAVPAAVPVSEPTWDDLPDEVIYETGPDASAVLTNADSPHLEAAFAAAAEVTPEAAAPGAAAAITARPAPAPVFRAPAPTAAPASRAHPPAPMASGAERPSSWQELQAQQPASSPHPHRRATERTTRWLRLRCGAQAYALELLKVQEVVLPVPLLPLRGTRPEMLGIMNLRGQVVPVMDLGVHLGAAAATEDALTRIVVLEENGEIMGLRVSAVEDVTNLSESQIEPPDTARICRISNDIFRGVARLQQQPMILLDATRLLT